MDTENDRTFNSFSYSESDSDGHDTVDTPLYNSRRDSDSDSDQAPASVTDNDSELFSSTVEEYTEACYSERLLKFKFWGYQMIRKLAMLQDIAQEELMGNWVNPALQSNFEGQIRRIKLFTQTLKKANRDEKSYFYLVFELHCFFEQCPPSFLLKKSLVKPLSQLLSLFLKSYTFESENYQDLKIFLRNFFEDSTLDTFSLAKSKSWNQITHYWRSSPYFSTKSLDQLETTRDFVTVLYFNVLKFKFEEALEHAAFPLPSVVQIGARNINFFKNFLQKYQIPSAGPYRNSDSASPRLLYFISSINPTDSIANNNFPLFGTFEFRLPLTREPTFEKRLASWRKLDMMPSWLVHYPPIFQLSLEGVRNQTLTAQEISL